jgi:ABC-type bacteriocin/lantibiotic exporter with double-glycine peptidase domain
MNGSVSPPHFWGWRYLQHLRRVSALGLILTTLVSDDAQHVTADKDKVTSAPSNQDAIVVSENLCGPNSLLVASFWMGCPLEIAELDRAFPNLGRPATMLELKHAAENLGLQCRAIRWAAGSAPQFPVPAIIALRMNPDRPKHYVVVCSQIRDHYQILDLGLPPAFQALSYLQSGWDGYALYIGNDTRALDSLVFDRTKPSWWLWKCFLGTSMSVVAVVAVYLATHLLRKPVSIDGRG